MDWTRHWETPYLVGTGDFPHGVNKLERGPDHSFQSNAEVYNLSTFTFTPTTCVRSIVIDTEKFTTQAFWKKNQSYAVS